MGVLKYRILSDYSCSRVRCISEKTSSILSPQLVYAKISKFWGVSNTLFELGGGRFCLYYFEIVTIALIGVIWFPNGCCIHGNTY